MDAKEIREFLRREEKKGFKESELRHFLYKKGCSVEDVDEAILELREEKIEKEEYSEPIPFFKKIWMVAVKPDVFYEEIKFDKDLGEAVKHFMYLNLLLLPAYILFFVLASLYLWPWGVGILINIMFALTLSPAVIFLSPLMLVALAGVAGVYLMIFGARWDFLRTSQILSYSLTVPLLVFWIPVVNVVALIYSLYLIYLGLMKLHEMVKWKAILSIVLSIVLLVLVNIFIL